MRPIRDTPRISPKKAGPPKKKLQSGPWDTSKNARRTVRARNSPFTRTASGVVGALGLMQLPFAGASMVSDVRAGFRQGANRKRAKKARGSASTCR